MSNSKKRKSQESNAMPIHFQCILHANGLNDYGDFVTLNSIKLSAEEKLAQLHSIRNKRLQESCDSPYRMHDVCFNIPKTISEIDLGTTGYHRGCYQAFTKNQDRLSQWKASETPNQKHHSPRIVPNAQNTFPPECIYCNKLERTASHDTGTERCVPFSMKVSHWKQIEPHALQMEQFSLYRKVQGEDLVAKSAMYHDTCQKKI